MLQFWIVSFAMLHEQWVSLDNRPAGKLQDLQQKARNLLMLEICFVLAMCFISFVHSCHYLLYSHGFSFLTEVTNTALGDLILCCCCVCVCVLTVCLHVCACWSVYVIFPSILIHVHTDIINTATCTVYLYITVTHVLLANICHAYVIGKHQSHIFFGKR